jgi:purine-binding chemotaxis protein CheW
MPYALQTGASQPVLITTFFVRDVLCGLDAAEIQEVIRLGPVTPVCHASSEVVGIVNLRGRIVTILDPGLRLGLPKAVPGMESRVFIIEDRSEFIGLLVDRVDEVVEVDAKAWQPPPANVSCGQGSFFKGVCRAHGSVITILDAPRILAEDISRR